MIFMLCYLSWSVVSSAYNDDDDDDDGGGNDVCTVYLSTHPDVRCILCVGDMDALPAVYYDCAG